MSLPMIGWVLATMVWLGITVWMLRERHLYQASLIGSLGLTLVLLYGASVLPFARTLPDIDVTRVGVWQVLVLVWMAATFALLVMRRWLPYYLVGAFGFTLLVAFGANVFHIDTVMEMVEALQVSRIARVLGLDVIAMGGTGLAIPTRGGWAVFDIGIECSAILEIAVIVGLTVFYPAFRPAQRAWYALIGLISTYLINIARLILIVGMVHALGTSWVFAAHAIFGRILFFAGTLILYWFLITRPTVNHTGRALAEEQSS